MSSSLNDFDAAKTMSELLKDMDKDRQQRIIRWVAESLDINVHLRVGVPHEGHPGTMLPSGTGGPSLPASAPTGSTTDIKSFVETKKAKSDIQFAAVVAYFYRFVATPGDQKESISAAVLQDAARLAGRTRFAKPLVTLNNAKKQGYLDVAERGSFRINSVGENLVAMALPGVDGAPKAKVNQKKKVKKTAAKPRG